VRIASKPDAVPSEKLIRERIANRLRGCDRFAHRIHPHAITAGKMRNIMRSIVSIETSGHFHWKWSNPSNARVDRLFALVMGARHPINGAKSQVERLVRAA
jgi:hypothetical protein